jgi:hypothetical protein
MVLSLGVGFLFAASAQAQLVTNGSFAVPSVASAPNGFLVGPNPALNVSGVGWTFPSVTGGDSGITVQEESGGLNAPQAPNGDQVGWIQNRGVIWQPVDLKPGGYLLTLELAQSTLGVSSGSSPPLPLPILIKIGDQEFGPYMPASATSYNEVVVPFQIAAAGTEVLNFMGQGPPLRPNVEDHTTFIGNVSIQPAPPNITQGPHDLDPTTSVTLQGSNFGSVPQKIKIVFPKPSETPFSNGSKSEIDLGSVGADDAAAFTQAIDAPYPTGKVERQTVNITLVSGDTGLVSNAWPATFHDKAVITSGPSAITPGQKFLLKGWDFDSNAECSSRNAGKVTVHFPLKSAVKFRNQGANPSDSDLVIPISGDGCQPDAVKITLPSDTQGVVRQTVDITYESPGGRTSNAWPAEFNPTLITLVAPYYWVNASCSNQSASDNCNNGKFGSCWSGPIPEWGLVGYWPPDLDSMVGDHHGCWGTSSDDGTDTYTLSLPSVGANGKPLTDPKDGWVASGFGNWGVEADNAFAGNGLQTNGCPNQQDCFPATYVQATVVWHIGATGGDIDYVWDIQIRGPVGVPLPLQGTAYPPY